MPRRAQSILIWLSTLLFALITVANGIGRDDRIIGDGVDVFGTFWFYWWVEHCFSNGISPGFSGLMFHPDGKDIFAHTGGNFVDALVSLPFQTIFGVPGFQAWFIGAVLIGNAASFRVLAGGLLSSPLAVWAASLLWMLNPYVLYELSGGRITQAFLWFLPLAIHHFMRAHTSHRSAILAGVFTGLQAWTYWFMAWFMVPAFACLAWAKAREQTVPVSVLLRGYGVAALAALVVAGPGLWMMADRMGGGPVAGLGSAGGLAGFVEALGRAPVGELQGWIANERHGAHTFGQWVWGALALSALLLPAGRRRWAWVLGVALAFSIGPTLVWADGQSIPMLHYQLAFHTVPFLERLWFPYRWTVMAFMAAALVGGFWVQRAQARWGGRWFVAVPVLLAMLTTVEQTAAGTIPLVTRGYQVPNVYVEIGERGGGIIELPLAVVRESLMWQPVHGQPLFGGMGENVPVFWTPEFKHAMGNHFIRALGPPMSGHARERLREKARDDLPQIRQRGMRWVVLDRHILMRVVARQASWKFNGSTPGEKVEQLTELMGTPVAVDGALVVWDLDGGGVFPAPMQADTESIQSMAWTGGDWAAYEARVNRENDH
jgi:hypothetical protein